MFREVFVAVAIIAAGEHLAAAEAGSDTPGPVLTAQELFADPEAMTDGTSVRLDGAVIRAKSGLVLRVAIDKHEIFVAPIDPSSMEFLAVGARVDIQGTLHRAPSAPQARLIYAMGPAEARRLARTGFYVDAWAVSAVD